MKILPFQYQGIEGTAKFGRRTGVRNYELSLMLDQLEREIQSGDGEYFIRQVLSLIIDGPESMSNKLVNALRNTIKDARCAHLEHQARTKASLVLALFGWPLSRYEYMIMQEGLDGS